MDWHQLKFFQTLASINNFTKTADELSLSQSALSRSISRLEEELGVPLFERKSRGVVLNRYGEIFLKHVNQAMSEIAEAKQEINNMVDPFHGTIALAFIQPLGSSFIPDLIGEFQNETPEIRFQLTQDTTKIILSKIESAEIDVGFCSPQESHENLSTFPIMNQELFLIVHKDHRLAGTEQVDLCEVANDPFIFYRPESALHDVIEGLCHNAGVDMVRETNPFAAVFGVNMLVNTDNGGTWTLDQYNEWLVSAGFTNVKLNGVADRQIVTAIKD